MSSPRDPLIVIGRGHHIETRRYMLRSVRFVPTFPSFAKTLSQMRCFSVTTAGNAALKQPVKVFFGSQTGTAQWFAELLRKDLRGKKIKADVVSLDSYDPEELSGEELAVFIMACYGKGEPTDNAKDFYAWLMANDREPGLLNHVNYAVFGLGNSKTYPERFQAVGIAVDKRISDLGAKRLLERGVGDDNGGIDNDFAQWKTKFMSALDAYTGETSVAPVAAYSAPFTVAMHEEGKLPRVRRAPTADQMKATKSIKHLSLMANSELFSENAPEDYSCRHIEIDLANSGLTYQAGDHLAVYPHNSPSKVERAANRLGINLDRYFSLVPKPGSNVDEAMKYPEPCTLRSAFTRHIDLHSFPKSDILKVMAQYAQNPGEKQELLKLASPDNKEYFESQILAERQSIVTVLENFPSVSLPLEVFLDVAERAKPRYYSISSSPKLHPTAVHLTVRTLEQKTPKGKVFRGKCTNYLVSQPVGDIMSSISCTTRESKFRLPTSPSTPVIMIGAGSGFAPLRGFMQERVAMKQSGVGLGPSQLYFGCMKRNLDFIYQDEIESAVASGAITEFHPAFSHEQKEFVFVQHKLLENKESVWDLVANKGAYVYVCGAAHTMAKGVYTAFLTIAKEVGGKNDSGAEVFLKQLESRGRYQQDIF